MFPLGRKALRVQVRLFLAVFWDFPTVADVSMDSSREARCDWLSTIPASRQPERRVVNAIDKSLYAVGCRFHFPGAYQVA